MNRYLAFCLVVLLVVLGAWSFNYEPPIDPLAGITVTAKPGFIWVNDSDLEISGNYSFTITAAWGAFPEKLFPDGYHYIYYLKANEYNNTAFPSYFEDDGSEYIDLGRVPSNFTMVDSSNNTEAILITVIER